MYRKCSLFCHLSAIILLTVTFLAQKGFGLMVEIPLERLTKKADHIIIGKVKSIRCEWNEEKNKIYTYVTIDVERSIKGASDTGEVTIRHLGGTVDSVTMWVSDTPRFQDDEKVLVFLRPTQGTYFGVAGMFQGKFTVKDNKVVEKDIPLEDFVDQIERTVRMQDLERR
jgi:hypothetical protein